jgi:hypothetical protein
MAAPRTDQFLLTVVDPHQHRWTTVPMPRENGTSWVFTWGHASALILASVLAFVILFVAPVAHL